MMTVIARINIENETANVQEMLQTSLAQLEQTLTTEHTKAVVSIVKQKVKASKKLEPMVRMVSVADANKVHEVMEYFTSKGCEDVSCNDNVVTASKLNGRGGFHKMAHAAAKLGGIGSEVLSR